MTPDSETLVVTLSDLASRELSRANESYRQRLLGRARSLSRDGEVDKSHVLAAEKELQPVAATGRTITQDWLKRIGFAALVGGISWLVATVPWWKANPVPVYLAATLLLVGLIFTVWAVIADVATWADIRQQNRVRKGQ